MEPFGAYADVEPDLARQLACIIRQKPVIFENGTTVVTASLVNLIQSIIKPLLIVI